MYAIRSYYGGAGRLCRHLGIVAGPDASTGAAAAAADDFSAALFALLFSDLHGRSPAADFRCLFRLPAGQDIQLLGDRRITSYNVCYTKLLRSLNSLLLGPSFWLESERPESSAAFPYRR